MIQWLQNKLGRTGVPLSIGAVMLIVALFLNISPANLEIIAFKFMIFCPAVALVHAIRRTMFPYLDLSDMYERIAENGSVGDQTDAAIVFAAIIFLYVCMTYTLVSAI